MYNITHLKTPPLSEHKCLLIICVSVFFFIVTGCNQLPMSDSERISELGKPPANAVLWSPVDRNRILVSAGYLDFSEGEIYILDIETGTKQIIASTERGMLFAETWSPDGKSVVVSAFKDTKGFEQGGLWMIDLESGDITYILTETINNIIWDPWQESFIFTRIQKYNEGKDAVEIVSRDIKTNAESVIFAAEENEEILGYSLSPNGQQLAFSMGEAGLPMDNFEIYILNMSSGLVDRITSGGDNKYPIWSPTGDTIVYQKKTTEGKNDIYSFYLINPNNSCTVQLLESDFLLPPTWSPDGNLLAFIEPNANGIFVLDIKDFLMGDYENRCQ